MKGGKASQTIQGKTNSIHLISIFYILILIWMRLQVDIYSLPSALHVHVRHAGKQGWRTRT